MFKADLPNAAALAQQMAAAHGGHLRRVYRTLKGFSVDSLPAQAADALRRNPNVVAVDQNRRISIAGGATTESTNGVQLGGAAYSLWGLDRIDQRGRDLNGTYTYGSTGQGVTIYVLDSGIDPSHPEFGGRASIGYDARWELGYRDGPAYGQDCNGHGTHVAGITGGATVGVAKGASIVAVRVLNCDKGGEVEPWVAGLDWVAANAQHPAVANFSIWSGVQAQIPTLETAAQRLVDANVLLVDIAGNNGGDNACLYSPSDLNASAGTNTPLTVGATQSDDARADFSNEGPCVDIFAPGSGIVSSWIGGVYSYDSGTSMAAPHVTGAVARYLEMNPNATAAQAKQYILNNATTGAIYNDIGGAPNRLLYTPVEQSSAGTISNAMLVTAWSGKCLDVPGASQQPGTQLISWTCNGNSSQRWILPAEGGRGEVRVYGSMCLALGGSGGANGDPAIIAICSGAANQQWTYTSVHELRGINGQCIDLALDPNTGNSGTADGTQITSWTCTGYAPQRWDHQS